MPTPDNQKKTTKKKSKGVFFKNDNWYIDYRLSNGRRRREKVGPSRKLAETVYSKRKVEIAEGKFLDVHKVERITFETFAGDYLTVHSKANKKSWKSDFYNLQKLQEYFGKKFLYELTIKDIEEFKSHRSQSVSPATVNRELATLKTLYTKAVAWDKVQHNPTKTIKFLKEPKGRLRFLEKEEIVRVLAHCSKKLKPIVILALNTGMRRGEILGLK